MRVPGRNDRCWCGSGKKYKFCHLNTDQEAKRAGGVRQPKVIIKSAAQIEGIRRACQLAKQTLDLVGERIGPGVTTQQIDEWIHEYMLAHNAIPATLGYRGYPKSSCTSINHVVCHGIPDQTTLKEGDIINVDSTAILDGYFGDISRMYIIGQTTPLAEKLVRVTKECTELGIQQVRPHAHLGDIGFAIQTHARQNGFSVVENIGGHGTGLEFHEEPWVQHIGRRGTGLELMPGMVFTVEPMINAGRPETETLADEWTIITKDHSLSAQWEHTIAVTENGVDILTA